jgi:hypothetical protein
MLVACLAAGEESDKPLSEGDLFELFGVAVSTNLTWTKRVGPDFNMFFGRSRASTSGEVGVYIGYSPDFDPDRFGRSVETQLGSFNVKWYKTVGQHGAIRQETVIDLKNDGLKAYIWIDGASQAEVDSLLKEVSELSPFLEHTAEKGL